MTINIGANIRIHKLGLCILIILLIILYLYAIRESSYLTTKANSRDFISLKSLLATSISAAELGGSEIVAVHKNSKLSIAIKGKTKENVDDPVTTADYKSHCAMFNYLSQSFPSLTIISEEQSTACDLLTMTDANDINESSVLEKIDAKYDVAVDVDDVTVWIDPLDATKEFTENLLEYVTTMVCVAVKGIPIIGVIHKPFDPKQTYWAWAEHGMSTNLGNLSKQKPTEPTIIVSRSHAGKVYNISKTALGDDIKIIPAAGAGYKSLEVAVRNVSAYIHATAIKKWDTCAGAAIISALGGTVTSLIGEQLNDFGFIDSVVLQHGILATMSNHKVYLEKFINSGVV